MDGLDHNLVHARVLKTDDLGIEQNLRRTESLRADLKLLAIANMFAKKPSHLELLSVWQGVLDALVVCPCSA